MSDNITDQLSGKAIEVLKVDAAQAYTRLVVHGPGREVGHALLSGMDGSDLFVADSAVAPAQQKAALAGLWLWHDWLDESHSISQTLHDTTGSFWHAIMHRREGDFSNSKYWYAKAKGHPALATIGARAGSVVSAMPADMRLLRIVARGFDPNAFVDFVEEVHDKPKDSIYGAAVTLQRLEWQALFDHCRR